MDYIIHKLILDLGKASILCKLECVFFKKMNSRLHNCVEPSGVQALKNPKPFEEC